MENIDNTKVAAYFLWEVTGSESALGLWHCAEDIASWLERNEFLSVGDVRDVLRMQQESHEYILFVRKIAFRLFIYTGRDDTEANWYDAERLLYNSEWLHAVTSLAILYSQNKGDARGLGIKNETVRDYYNGKN